MAWSHRQDVGMALVEKNPLTRVFYRLSIGARLVPDEQPATL